jgi:hypothetical protein
MQVSARSGSPITLLAKPIYEATKQGEWEPIVWGEEQKKKTLKEIKRALQMPLL